MAKIRVSKAVEKGFQVETVGEQSYKVTTPSGDTAVLAGLVCMGVIIDYPITTYSKAVEDHNAVIWALIGSVGEMSDAEFYGD